MKFFKDPFRPFFTLTAFIAVLVPMYFVGVIVNGYYFPEELITVNYWHAHEMIFGFTTALLAGFILTAAPKWTQKSSVTSTWSIAIILAWLLARLIVVIQPSEVALYILAPLPLLLLIYKVVSILKGNENLPLIGALLISFLSVQLLSLYAVMGENYLLLETSYKIVSFIVVTFLIVFSGRLIPFFVNSRIKSQNLIQNKKQDLSIVGIAFLSLISSLTEWIELTATLSSLAFLMLSYRFKNLYCKEVLARPMLWILYIGHLWINLYFLLNAITLFTASLDEGRAVIHTLFAGALGTISIGMMFRVSLGHSGLEMKASKLIRYSFYSMIIGSIARVAHPVFMGGLDQTLLHSSMGFWTLAYILYLGYFLPKFVAQK